VHKRSSIWFSVIGVVAAVSIAVPATPAAALLESTTISGLCGTAAVARIPADLRPGASESGAIRVFQEQVDASSNDFVLTTPVAVDITGPSIYSKPSALPVPKPEIPAESVASYLVHWDPPGDPTTAVRRTITIGFSGAIKGVQVLAGTVNATESQQFHAHHVTYPASAEGLQLAASGRGDRVRMLDQFTVSISFTGINTVKEFRIITAPNTGRYSVGIGPGPHGSGFSMLAGDGGVFVVEPTGGFWGSLGATRLNQPVVGGARTCRGNGYWLVARDGGVFSFGEARFFGSLGNVGSAAPVVGMAATATGGGYYLATATGAVSAFGDAQFAGDTRALHLNRPIVGIAATPTGNGYWLVASDGGIFAYGDAAFSGSTGGIRLNRPIVGMRPSPNGDGYYLLASDGGVFTFSSPRPFAVPTPFFGSAGGSENPHSFVGMRLAADGAGYWLVDNTGRVFGYGPSAPSSKGVSDTHLTSPILAVF
jgi:hypothetical protein